MKPRPHHRKMQLSTALDSSKKDQATSMSHLNLISAVHMEMVSSSCEADLRTPMLKPSYNTSRDFSSREELISRHDDKSRFSFDNVTPGSTLRKDYHKSVEIYPLQCRKVMETSEGYESHVKQDYRRSFNSVMCHRPVLEKQDKEVQASVNHIGAGSKQSVQEHIHLAPSASEKEQIIDRSRPTECIMSRSVDHLERPTSFPRPGQLICYNSVDQVNDSVYRNVLPTLVIPAHYMKLSDHPYVSQQLVASADQQFEIERLQAELSNPQGQLLPRPQQPHTPSSQTISQEDLHDVEEMEWSPQNVSMSESMSIPASLNEAALAQMNGDVQLLTEKALMELTGGKPMPHPRAWFVSLDGRSNAHIRHSYIDLQRAGKNGSNDASLDSGVDMNEPKSARKMRAEKLSLFQHHQSKLQAALQAHQQKEQSTPDNTTYTQLVYLEDLDQGGSESGTPICSPEENSLRSFFDAAARRNGSQLPSLQEEPIKRTMETSQEPLTSPEHGPSSFDENTDEQGENKKSPWQKREERPLLAFNTK